MIPMDILVTVAADDIPIIPDQPNRRMYTTIYNTGETRIMVNFVTTAAVVRTEGNIDVPPGGLLANLQIPLSSFSVISNTVNGRILVHQHDKPLELSLLKYDNPLFGDAYDVTAVNDGVFVAYAYATIAALGAGRITSFRVECLLNDIIFTFNGTAPARGPPIVGIPMAVGDELQFPVDVYTDLQFTNAVIAANGQAVGQWVGI